MAYDLGTLNKYRYFKEFGLGAVDKTFIENVLLPGLETQGRHGGMIELPHGVDEPAEYLPLQDAARIAIDWLDAHSKIGSDEQRNLEKLIGKSSYQEIAITLQLVFRNRVNDPEKLLSTRLAQNLASMKEVQEEAKAKAGSRFNPAQDFLTWNKITTEVNKLAAQGVPANLIAQLIPAGLSANSDVTRQRFIQLAINNLPEFVSAKRIAQSDKHFPTREFAAGEVTRVLEKVISEEYPDMAGLLNFTRRSSVEMNFFNFVEALEQGYVENIEAKIEPGKRITLEDWGESKIKASFGIPFLLPPKHELRTLIPSALPFLTTADKQKITSALYAAMVSSSSQALTADQILFVAGKSLGMNATELNKVALALHNSGFDLIVEHYQNELSFDLAGKHLTSSERALLGRGINPFEAQTKLDSHLLEARRLLNIPGGKFDSEYARASIQSRLDNLENVGGDPLEILRLRSWLSRHDTLSTVYHQNNRDILSLADRSRTERWFYNANDKFRNAETAFWNKWFTIGEELPWNKGARKAYETYEKLASGGTFHLFGKDRRPGIISIPLGKGQKLDIPYLRLGMWGAEQVLKVKRIATLRLYRRITGKNWGLFDPLRRGLRFSIREYALGGYNYQGALFHMRGKVWGYALGWAVGKLGLQSVFKYSAALGGKTVANAGLRTATRLLIKMGGKALAKIGAKALGSLIAAATVIGSVLSVLGVISMAIDLLKMGGELIKQFLHNPEFRKTVLKYAAIGSAISTGFIAIVTGLPLLIAAGLGLLALGLAVLALDVLFAAGVALALFTLFFMLNSMLTFPTTKIDGGLNVLQSIVCDMTKDKNTTTSSDPTANAAICIAQILTKCNLNPLFGSAIGTGKWQCVVASLVFPGAVSQLQISAGITDSWGQGPHLQCVGLAAASAGPDFPQRDAKTYASNPPPGWKPGGCKPGSLFVDTGGEVGHIGVVIDCDGGDNIVCVDANYTGAGVVRDPSKCRYAKSLVATYLNRS